MNKKILYGNFVKWLDNGRNQMFGRIWGVLTIVIQVATYLTVTGTRIEPMDIIYYSIMGLIVFVIGGYLYSKFGFFSAEVSSRIHETPELMETLNNTREIKKKLGLK